MTIENAAEMPLLTDKDLGKRWGLAERTIKRWRKDGKTPPAIAIGHKGGFGQGVRYKLEDVIAFEESRKGGSACHSTMSDAESAEPGTS